MKHTKGEPQLADWGTMIRRAVPPASDDHDPSIVLTRDPVAGLTVLGRECESLPELQALVDQLKSELDDMIREARF